MQATGSQHIDNINIVPHMLHHFSDAGKSMCMAPPSKRLSPLKAHIAERDNLCMIHMLLNGLYVLFGDVSTADNGESFLLHAFLPHVLQTTIEIQKISLVDLPTKLIEKCSRGTCLSGSLLLVLIESQNGRSQCITVFRLEVADHLLAEV